MTTVTTHERPGVYSRYEASALVSGSSGGKTAGLAARSGGGEAGQLYALTRYEDAATVFGKDDPMTALVKLLFRNGVAGVLAVPVADESGYADAFSALAAQETAKVLVCDSTDLAVQQSLCAAVADAAETRREKIAVVCGGALAAAAAGAICAQTDPAVPLGGAVLEGLPGLSVQYTDTELDALIRGGVTPVEYTAGEAVVVRGVTTRTTTAGAADSTWRELSTILVVDHVIPAVRSALASRFARAKNTAQVRSAIRSQVILELEQKLAAEIITGYGTVSVSQVEDNPTVCLVEFSFTVAHGLNQVWLSAKITV